MNKQFFMVLIAVLLVSTYAVFRVGSRSGAPSVQSVQVSYAKDVRPILESRCAACHMGEFVSEGLDMNSYESLLAGSQNGPVIIPGNANDSLLIEKVTEGKMPKKGPKLTPNQIQIITDWINAGALNN